MINIPFLPHIEKLKLEIQLVLMKQLLLMPAIETRIKDMPRSEEQFQEILAEVEDICRSSDEDSATRLTAVTSHLKKVMEELKAFLVLGQGHEMLAEVPGHQGKTLTVL